MPDGQSLAMIMASWPAPEESRIGCVAALGDGLSHGVDDIRVEGHRRVLLVGLGLEIDVATGGDLAQARQQRLLARRRTASDGLRRSMLNSTQPGITFGRAGQGLDAADRGDEVGRGGGEVLDGEDHLAGGRERVAARAHRHGPGVTGKAAHGDQEAHGAVDGGDGGQRQSLVVEHGALLDVQLQVGGDHRPSCARMRGRLWRRRRPQPSASRTVMPSPSFGRTGPA